MQNKKNIQQPNYSFFTELLIKIDDQLEALDNFSNREFLELNRNFKSFHQQSTGLDQMIVDTFHKITEKEPVDIAQQFTYLIEEWHNYFTHRKNILYGLNEMINSINHQFEQLFIPLNNLKQNLLTLKLLLTNLKVGNLYKSDNAIFSISHIDQAIKQLITSHKEIQNTYHKLFKELTESKNEAENIYNILSEKEKETMSRLKEGLEQYFFHINTVNTHKEIYENPGQAGEENIEEIITQLQYHDIIKQRLSHIQETHQELICELQEIRTNKNNEKLEHVHHVVELQSAQLIHTNRKYQTAVSEITNKFNKLSDLIKQRVNNTRLLLCFEKQTQTTFLSDLLKEMNLCSLKFRNKKPGHQNINQLIHNINSRLHVAEENIRQISEIESGITSGLDQSLDGQKRDESTFNQISEVVDEIKKTCNYLSLITENISNIGASLQSKVSEMQQESSFEENLKHYENVLNEALETKENEILSRLHQINKNEHHIIQDIKNALSGIKYYSFFEKEVNKIIDALSKVVIEKTEKTTEDDSRLRDIRKRYTMASEHHVHHHYVSNQVSSETGDDLNDPETQTGELELF